MPWQDNLGLVFMELPHLDFRRSIDRTAREAAKKLRQLGAIRPVRAARTGPLDPSAASPWELDSWNPEYRPAPPPLPEQARMNLMFLRLAAEGIPAAAGHTWGQLLRDVKQEDLRFVISQPDAVLADLARGDSERFAELADAAVRHDRSSLDPVGSSQFLRLMRVAAGDATDEQTRAGRMDRVLSRMREAPETSLPAPVAKAFLALKGGGAAIPDDWAARERYLDAFSNTRQRPGNRVEVLLDGPSFFPRLFKEIRAERRSFIGTTFIIDPNDTGWEFAGASVEAAKNGALVRFLCDQLGTLTSSARGGVIDTLKKATQKLANFEFRVQPPTALMGHVTHRKLMVLGGKVAYIADMNFGDVYKQRWHGMAMRLEGPIVSDCVDLLVEQQRRYGFSYSDEELAALKPEAAQAADGSKVRLMGHEGAKDRDLKYAFIRAIDTAVDSIDIHVPYFDDPDIIAALHRFQLRARERGTGGNVRIFLPYDCNHKIAGMAAKGLIRNLTRYNEDGKPGRIEVFAYAGAPMSHLKAFIFDKKLIIHGSLNLDVRSLSSQDLRIGNDEAVVEVSDEGLAQELTRTLMDAAARESYPMAPGTPVDGWVAYRMAKQI